MKKPLFSQRNTNVTDNPDKKSIETNTEMAQT